MGPSTGLLVSEWGAWRHFAERTAPSCVPVRQPIRRRPSLLHVLLGLLELLGAAWEAMPCKRQPCEETAEAEAWLDRAALLATGAGFGAAALLDPKLRRQR